MPATDAKPSLALVSVGLLLAGFALMATRYLPASIAGAVLIMAGFLLPFLGLGRTTGRPQSDRDYADLGMPTADRRYSPVYDAVMDEFLAAFQEARRYKQVADVVRTERALARISDTLERWNLALASEFATRNAPASVEPNLLAHEALRPRYELVQTLQREFDELKLVVLKESAHKRPATVPPPTPASAQQ